MKSISHPFAIPQTSLSKTKAEIGIIFQIKFHFQGLDEVTWLIESQRIIILGHSQLGNSSQRIIYVSASYHEITVDPFYFFFFFALPTCQLCLSTRKRKGHEKGWNKLKATHALCTLHPFV